MPAPPALQPFYDGLANQQKLLLDSIRPLTPEQMQLRPAPGEWAIWQLCSNMAGGRLYWLCRMLGEPDLGLSGLFRVERATVPGIDLQWAGWEDNEDRPRTAGEIASAFEKTWQVVEACIDRWTPDDLVRPVTATGAWGQPRTITPAQVLAHIFAHEVHHGSEVSLILRVHNLPTAINR